jgi:hypothetical protein
MKKFLFISLLFMCSQVLYAQDAQESQELQETQVSEETQEAQEVVAQEIEDDQVIQEDEYVQDTLLAQDPQDDPDDQFVENEEDHERLISGKYKSGGYGAPVFKISEIKDNFAFFIGARGGWIINHKIVVGGGVYALMNRIDADVQNGLRVNMGYGGVMAEYIMKPSNLLHLNFSLLIGGGGFGYGKNNDDVTDHIDTDSFFVAEPEIDVMLNIVKSFKIGIGLSVRIVNGTEMQGIKDSDLTRVAGNIIFQIGKF